VARVLVSIPSFAGVVRSKTAESVANISWGDHEVVYSNVIGYDCTMARKAQVKRAIEEKADYLLFVDWDIVLPEDALVNLVEHDVDACTGYYVRGLSDEGRTVVVVKDSYNYDSCYYLAEIAAMRGNGRNLVEVKASGLGCFLVKTEVFQRLPQPWFQFRENADDTFLGEDYFFCEKLLKAGVRVHMDTRVGCNHIHDRELEAM